MKSTDIIFVCKENGGVTSKKLSREEVKSVFEGLKNGFPDDNEVSKALLRVIPEVDRIEINKDINATQTEPFVEIHTGEKVEIIKIIRYHKIVWSILDNYCEQTKKE